jgi:hypothetical protein
MTALLLRRSFGPSGTIRFGNATTTIEGWELIEGEAGSTPTCHGSFRCTDESFRARKGTDLVLHFQTWDDQSRELPVTITQMIRPEFRWTFRARR